MPLLGGRVEVEIPELVPSRVGYTGTDKILHGMSQFRALDNILEQLWIAGR